MIFIININNVIINIKHIIMNAINVSKYGRNIYIAERSIKFGGYVRFNLLVDKKYGPTWK